MSAQSSELSLAVYFCRNIDRSAIAISCAASGEIDIPRGFFGNREAISRRNFAFRSSDDDGLRTVRLKPPGVMY